MPTFPELNRFDFGPDVDPLHDPVFDDDAIDARIAAANASEHATRGASTPPDAATPDATTPDAEGTAHDDASLADDAWSRFIQGHSYGAIARQLQTDRASITRLIHATHEQAQTDRHSQRALALTRALAALQRIQATAWDQIELDTIHERLVWDFYCRAAAQAADMKHALAAGYSVRPPTFHARTTRLLALILAAVREAARLELLYDQAAPARAGDIPDEHPKNAFWYFLRRRSDEEALAREQQQAGVAPTTTRPDAADATGAPTPTSPSAPQYDPPSPQSAEAACVAAGLPAATVFADARPADARPAGPAATASAAPGAPSPDDAWAPPHDPPSPQSAQAACAAVSLPAAHVFAGGLPATQPFALRDADGNIPLPTPPHPEPALRPDGTDDWFVWKRVPLPTPEDIRRARGQPSRRRRPWDRQW